MAVHELLESLLVETRLDSRELLLIRPQDGSLGELLRALVAVPELQEVDDGDVVGLQAVGAREPVALKALELGRRAGAGLIAAQAHTAELLGVDLDF